MEIREEDRRWVRPKEAYMRLGCGNDKLYQFIKDGRLETKKIDGMRLIWLPSILNFDEPKKRPTIAPKSGPLS